jgi:hypothetical protein
MVEQRVYKGRINTAVNTSRAIYDANACVAVGHRLGESTGQASFVLGWFGSHPKELGNISQTPDDSLGLNAFSWQASQLKHCGPFSDIGHCFDTRPTPRRHSDTGGTPLKILCSEPLLFITDYCRKLDVAGSRLTGLP